jgi:exonuclease III
MNFCYNIKLLFFSTLFLFTTVLPIFSSDTECKYSPQNIGDRRIDKNTFRVVQYNVEWLFIDEYNNQCPGSSCTWANQSEALKHMDYVSDVINSIGGDYINFCEVEGCDELNMLIEKTNNDYKSYLIKGSDTSTGQNVGILTKVDVNTDLQRNDGKYTYPVANSKCGYTGSPSNTGVSKHYYTTININGINIAIIGSHLLAIPTDPARCATREAQAQILQDTILYMTDKGYEIIVLGDMNDYDNEILDSNNNIPTSMVLDILKGNEGEFKNYYKLNSVSSFIQKEDRYSDWWDENKDCQEQITDFSMIDHILVSDNLFKKIDNVFIYHGYKEYCGKYDSDHFPVGVDFIL